MFCVFCLVVFCLALTGANNKIVFGHKPSSGEITYCFYTNDNIKEDDDVLIVNNGANKMVYCSFEKAGRIKGLLNNIFGESFCIKNANSFDKEYIFENIKKTKILQENFENMQIFYCFDANLPKFVKIDGKKVNIQVAVCGDNITMGYPLILGEY